MAITVIIAKVTLTKGAVTVDVAAVPAVAVAIAVTIAEPDGVGCITSSGREPMQRSIALTLLPLAVASLTYATVPLAVAETVVAGAAVESVSVSELMQQ